MAEKDISEKNLEALNDVFADITNTLLFGGERIISESELEAALPRSVYKADGRLREQERDTAKYWKHSSIRLALIGFENQTAQEDVLPLRIIGYDGAAYREQLSYESDERGKRVRNRCPRYPVITLVLYFGSEPWRKPRSLLECLDIPKPLKPYVNDYPLHIFEIAQLTEEQVERFQSDFRIIADYFVQLRRHQRYTPQGTRLRHPQETLRLMSVLTNDRRFEESCNDLMEEGKEVQNMCEVLDRIEARGEARGRAEGEARGRAEGEARGRAEGEARGRAEGRLHTLYALTHDGLLSAAVAAERADMTEEQFLSGMKAFYL
ncbi:MAG: Rpn family recombination-promoting nuclease/putative transposase [Stomatobaculum sp.]